MSKPNYRLLRKLLFVVMALSLLVPVLAACSKAGSGDDEEERVLRIAITNGYGPDDENFRQSFTDIYEFTHKNIKIELMPIYDDSWRYGNPPEGAEPFDPLVKLREMMDGDNPPDIVAVDYDQLFPLIQENRLVPLEPRMTESKLNLDDFVPAVLDGLKKASPDGELYALAPSFSSSALFYNTKLFDEANVPYPEDNMTWDQIFDKARLLANGEGADRKYGFSFSQHSYGDLFWDSEQFLSPLGLRYFDDELNGMTVNTPQWERAWSTLIQLKKDRILTEPPQFNDDGPREWNPLDHDAFLSGRTAMAIGYYGYLNEILTANRNAANIKNFEPISWNVVTVPVHPENPDVGGYVNLTGIMGISANAQSPDVAWDFLKFINSEDWAKLKSRSLWNLPSRKKYIETKEGQDYNVAAFYQLSPSLPMISQDIYRKYQNIWFVRETGQRKWNEVVNENKDVKKALEEWENEGNQALRQIRENPRGPFNYDDFMPAPMPMPGIESSVEAEEVIIID